MRAVRMHRLPGKIPVDTRKTNLSHMNRVSQIQKRGIPEVELPELAEFFSRPEETNGMRRQVELVARAAALVMAGGLLTAAGGASAAETPAAFGTLPPEIKALYVGVEDTIQPAAFDN